MDLDLDGGTILYALGIGFALAALAYFARDVVFALSITVKAALLFVAFLAFLLGGIAMDRDVLDRVSLVLSAAAYVVFLVYVITRYDLAATGVFLVLAASAALFLALGYLLRQHRPTISPRTARGIAVALVAIAVLFVGADVATGEVVYDVDLEDRVTVVAPDDVRDDREYVPTEATLGRLVVTNEGPFTRQLDVPRARGCVVGTDAIPAERIYLQYERPSDGRPTRIGGGGTLEYDVFAQIPLSNQTDEMTLAVERGSDCDSPRGEPTLIVDVDGATDGRAPVA